MERHELDVIHARLEKAERRLRMTLVGWVGSLVALVLLGAGVQHATSQPTALRVRSLEVVDEQGLARIVLSVDRVPGESEVRPGVSGVWLLDASGRRLATLGSAPNGFSSLSFSDPARPLQFGTVSLDGLILSDLRGRGRIQLSSDGLSLWDTGRRMRILLALHADESVGLTLFDPAGNLRTALDVDDDGSAGLAFFDGAGRRLFGAP